MINLTKKLILQALDCGLGSAIIVDVAKPEQPIVYVSPVFEELTGYDSSELIDRPLGDLVMDGDMPAVSFDQVGGLKQQWVGKNGAPLELSFKVSPLFSRPGPPAYLLLTESAADEPMRGEASPDGALRVALNDARVRLKRLEPTDSVTGLVNRKAFLEILQRDWSIARRTQQSIAVILFALEDFDEYREVFGRHAAESCLRKVAHAVNGSLRRDSDVVARYDHDKFVTLIGSAEEGLAADFAARIAEKVRKLSIHHPRSRNDRFVTLSFGVAAETPERTASCSVLLDSAEVSLREFRANCEKQTKERAG